MIDARAVRILALEQSLHQPEVRRDPVAVGALLSTEFREFGASGRAWSREETLAALAAEPPFPPSVAPSAEAAPRPRAELAEATPDTTPVEIKHAACLHLAETLSLLTYRARRGSRVTLRSSLWRLKHGQWRMLFHQGTLVPGE